MMNIQSVHHSLWPMLSGGDTIAHACKQLWILCTSHWKCQYNKVHRMFISTTYFRQV